MERFVSFHTHHLNSGHKLGEEFTIPIVASEKPKWNAKIIFKQLMTRDIPKVAPVLVPTISCSLHVRVHGAVSRYTSVPAVEAAIAHRFGT